MVLRVCRIFKIFHAIHRFRIVINTIIHILPSFATYGCLLGIVFYFFAVIGMESFGGKFKFDSNNTFCGNPKLNVSSLCVRGPSATAAVGLEKTNFAIGERHGAASARYIFLKLLRYSILELFKDGPFQAFISFIFVFSSVPLVEQMFNDLIHRWS